MKRYLQAIILVLYICIFLFIIRSIINIESYANVNDSTYILGPHYDNYGFPVFNMLQPGSRRLSSYDIRGDPPINYQYIGPWNNPEVMPLYNPQLEI